MKIKSAGLILLLFGAPAMGGTKDSYLNKADKQVQTWSAKVDDLQKRAQTAGAKTRSELDRQVALLREKLDVVRQKVDELRNSSESGWKRFQKGADESLRDLRQAYQKTTHFFEKDEKEKP